MRRKVKIEKRGDTWFVIYLDRKPRQRHTAAQFLAENHTYESIASWVNQRDDLQLVREGAPQPKTAPDILRWIAWCLAGTEAYHYAVDKSGQKGLGTWILEKADELTAQEKQPVFKK